LPFVFFVGIFPVEILCVLFDNVPVASVVILAVVLVVDLDLIESCFLKGVFFDLDELSFLVTELLNDVLRGNIRG
jgi:hypothetical protein